MVTSCCISIHILSAQSALGCLMRVELGNLETAYLTLHSAHSGHTTETVLVSNLSLLIFLKEIKL